MWLTSVSFLFSIHIYVTHECIILIHYPNICDSWLYHSYLPSIYVTHECIILFHYPNIWVMSVSFLFTIQICDSQVYYCYLLTIYATHEYIALTYYQHMWLMMIIQIFPHGMNRSHFKYLHPAQYFSPMLWQCNGKFSHRHLFYIHVAHNDKVSQNFWFPFICKIWSCLWDLP